jgi:hypothetical protein
MRILRLAALAFLLLPAAPAVATDYCVTPETSCAPANTFTEIQPALTAAQAPGDDVVLIGSRTFDLPAAGLQYNGDKIDIIGTGATPAVLRQQATSSSDAALQVFAAGPARSSVRALDFVVAQNTTGTGGGNVGLGLQSSVDVSDITVTASSDATRAIGVTLADTSTLARADIDLGYRADTTTGVIDSWSATDSTRVRDSAIRADTGVFVSGGATLTAERTELAVSTQGLWAFDGSIAAHNPVVALEPQAAVTNSAFIASAGSRDTSLDIRYATVTGGDANSVGMFVQSSATNAASGSLLGSIVRNTGTSLYRAGPAGSPGAHLAANYNAFHPAAVEGNNPASPGTFSDLNARTDDPRFLGDPALGELRLRHDSPLIDAGHPIPLVTPTDDFEADPRVVDGNGDGTMRADLGAFEYQRRAPIVFAAAAPSPVFPDDPVTWSASGTDQDGDPVTYSWSWDDGATATGASVTHAFTPLGAHTGTVTATDATGLTATASASATVNERPAPAPGGGDPGGGAGGGEGAGGDGGDLRPPVDRQGPVFAIAGRNLSLSRRNTVSVRLTCDRRETEPCAGTLRLASSRRVVRRRRVLSLGRAPFSIQPGRLARVRIGVSRRNAATARRLRRFRVTATAVARDAAGNRTSKRRSATLVVARTRR